MVSEVPQIGRNWWLFVVLGLVCLVAGILAMVWPGITLLTLGILARDLSDGLRDHGDRRRDRRRAGGRALSAILGIVSLIAGLICIRRPGESLLAIVIVAGIYLVAEGVIRVVRAFSTRGPRCGACCSACSTSGPASSSSPGPTSGS